MGFLLLFVLLSFVDGENSNLTLCVVRVDRKNAHFANQKKTSGIIYSLAFLFNLLQEIIKNMRD